jgi:hypothetical protein
LFPALAKANPQIQKMIGSQKARRTPGGDLAHTPEILVAPLPQRRADFMLLVLSDVIGKSHNNNALPEVTDGLVLSTSLSFRG